MDSTIIHWAEPGRQSLCTGAGETSYVEQYVTCTECLCHLIVGILESQPIPARTLLAVLQTLDS